VRKAYSVEVALIVEVVSTNYYAGADWRVKYRNSPHSAFVFFLQSDCPSQRLVNASWICDEWRRTHLDLRREFLQEL
jgi:hypothetical protein